MPDVVEEVRNIKAQAMDARDRGDLDVSVRLLRDAEELLQSTLDELTAKRGQEPPGREEINVANQLLHIRGSIGGTLRRKGDYDDAIAAYDEGRKLEAPESGYGIVNSYNLVQALVTRIFLDPAAVEEGAPAVADHNVHADLIAAGEEIHRQMQGPRSDDEYAAADNATVRLLLDASDWEDCLDDFFALNPEPYAIEVTREVLDDLHTRAVEVGDAPGDLAARLSTAVDRLNEHS